MPNLATFADFLKATRDVKATPAGELLSEATRNNYFLNKMLKGRGLAKTFKGGKKLIELIQTDTAGNFRWYDPMDERTPTARDVLKQIEVQWAMAESNMPFSEEETDYNEGDPSRFIDLKKSYEMALHLDMFNGLEDALWALPDVTLMESATMETGTARRPYSLLAFVTRDGLAPSSTNGGVATGTADWTTVETINPTTNTWWRNAYATYTVATADDPDAGYIQAMERAIMRASFEMPEGDKRYATSDTMQKQIIVTNEDGIVFHNARCRALNDRMNALNDPAITGPQFKGIPIKHVEGLDSAGWTSGSPDFIGLNFNFLCPYFHSKWYMKQKVTDGGSTQPNTHVLWQFTHMQNFLRSRRRQWRVSAA